MCHLYVVLAFLYPLCAVWLQVQAVEALICMGEIHSAAGNPAGAFPYALNALLHCQLLQTDLLGAKAMLLLAQLWLVLAPGGREFALQLLWDVLPLVVAHGSLDLQGRVQHALAEGLLAGLQDTQEIGTIAPQAIHLLRGAAGAYERVWCWDQAAECWELLAHVCHAMSDEAARNDAAGRCLSASQRSLAVK